MPGKAEFNKNFFFMYQSLLFISMLMLRVKASKTEYKGYFKRPSGSDYLVVSNSRCTRNNFMDEVTKSTDNGGCGAQERNIDLSNVFGTTTCSTDLRSSYITRYDSADSIFDECLCEILKKVDGDCDEQTLEIIGYVLGALFVCGVVACVGVACVKTNAIEKTVNCFGSLKNSALSLTDRCKRIGTTDNPRLESGEPGATTTSSYNLAAFFSKFLKTRNPEATNTTELQETVSPP